MGVPDLHPLDWFVLVTTLLFIVLYGVYKTRKMDSGVKIISKEVMILNGGL